MMLGPIVPGGSLDAKEIKVLIRNETGELVEKSVAEALGDLKTSTSRFVLADYQRISSSTNWDRVAELEARFPGVPLDLIRLDIDIVGGGASGQPGTTSTSGSLGGAAGGVTRLKMIHPLELPELVAVVIGAGGASEAAGGVQNAGGATSFGDWRASGGPKHIAANATAQMVLVAAPSDRPSVAPCYPVIPAISYGPGHGGYSQGGTTPPTLGDGANGGADNLDYMTLGSTNPGDSSQPALPGESATGPYGFGAGGRGAYRTGSDLPRAGAGGTPGGGGGGGRSSATAGVNGHPGPGGDGGVTIRYFVAESALAEDDE